MNDIKLNDGKLFKTPYGTIRSNEDTKVKITENKRIVVNGMPAWLKNIKLKQNIQGCGTINADITKLTMKKDGIKPSGLGLNNGIINSMIK